MNDIKKYRLAKGLTQAELSRMVGITQGALSGWERGRYEPDLSSLTLLSEILQVSVDQLLGRADTSAETPARIPVYGHVPAGLPLEAITDILDYEEITPEMARKGQYIALRIRGQSMIPVICHDDTVIVRLQEDADSGDTVIALIGGQDATCKKLKKAPEGVWLLPNNPAFEPMFFTNRQIEQLPVRILGVVAELRRTFKH